MVLKKRLTIKPKDISIILQISFRQAQRKYQQAKSAHGRVKHQEITFKEFGEYFGLKEQDLYDHLL